MASVAEVEAAARCNSLEDLLLTVRLDRYAEALRLAGLDLEGLLRVQSKDELKQRYGLKLAPAAQLFRVAQAMRSERERTLQRRSPAAVLDGTIPADPEPRQSHRPAAEPAATSTDTSSLAAILFGSTPRTPADYRQTIRVGKDKRWAELTKEEKFAARRLGWQTEASWEAGESTGSTETWFEGLASGLREAAELLGYDATTWNRELEEPAENEPESSLEEPEPAPGVPAAINAAVAPPRFIAMPQQYASYANAAQQRDSRFQAMQQKNQPVAALPVEHTTKADCGAQHAGGGARRVYRLLAGNR